MPLLSFIHPETLWLIILLVPLVLFTRYAPHRLSPLPFWITTGLRALLILFLILSLAGTQVVLPVHHLTTIFILDSSDSISPSARGRAELFIQEALRTKELDDQAGIVVFGENALVERSPTSYTTLGRITSIPIATHTNIEKAIQLGLALFPAETQKRLVLLSDGGENSGHAQAAAHLAAARNIPIDIVDLSAAVAGDEALIASLDAPYHARDGQTIELVTTIESTVEQHTHLRLFADEKLLTDQQVHLAVGRNQFRYTATVEGQGFRRYRVRIEPDNDVRVQNNEAALLVQIQGPPHVLLVEGSKGEARNLHEALEATNIVAETISPQALPATLADLSAYEATVLINVPARTLPASAFTTLPAYVRDLGKGLVMVGGTESYGVGGYGHTTIEEALPVYMEVRSREERPNLAIVFLIDKSGSMDACHCSGNSTSNKVVPVGDRKVDIAKEAVTQASALMTSQDTLSIVTFDDEAHQVFPPTQDPDPLAVSDAVAQVEPRGATNVGAGLVKAEEVLNSVDARIKHVILLTDGWGSSSDHNVIARRMKNNGITLSVVAAGSGSADYLAQLANTGGGRYYAVEDMSTVPQIFLNETINVAGNYIIEESFIPMIASDSTIMHGINGNFPVLYGYNGTTIKETAQSILIANGTTPLLAEWNYGLGRTIAWTSDMKGKWSYNLVQWDNYTQFSAQLIERVLPTAYPSHIDTDIQIEGTFTNIIATVQDESGNARESLQVEAHIIEGSSIATAGTDDSETRQRVQLTQVAPGEYRAMLPNPVPGTYLVQLVGREQERIVFQNMSGLVVPYSSEYRQNQSNPGLLDELRQLTQGRLLTDHAESFAYDLTSETRAHNISLTLLWLALMLLPFDIALRRVLLRWSDIETFVSRIRIRVQRQLTVPASSPVPDPVVARLAQAKQRARKSGTNSSSVTDESPPSLSLSSSSSLPHSSTPSSSQPSPSPHRSSASPPQATPDDPMERLREAKERARRRARGEE